MMSSTWILLLVAVVCFGKRAILSSLQNKMTVRHQRLTMLVTSNHPTTTAETTTTTKPNIYVSLSNNRNSLTCFSGQKQPELDTHTESKQADYLWISTSIRHRIYKWFEEIDKVLDGSVLGYADTTPFNVTEPIGALFLLTNVVYAWASLAMWQQGGNPVQALVIDAAGLLSINYHWNQLVKGPNNNDVRIALILDYFGAFLAIFLILEETVYQSITAQVPVTAIFCGVLGLFNLVLSWVFANGAQYIFFHSLWHLFSGVASYVLFSRLTS